MWTSKDFDKLQTFSEWTEEHGTAELYNGTRLENDEATQEALSEVFYWRKVSDNERFGRYFRRMLVIYGRQYYDLIRIETTEMDPLVQNYLERQTLHSGSKSESGTNSETSEGSTGRTSKNKGNGGSTSTTTTNSTATGTGRSTADTTEQGSTQGTSANNSRAKHGETPQAATGGGMALDWTYLSSQDETDSNGTTTGSTTGRTETIGTTSDNSTSNGTATTTVTDSTSGEVTETGNDSRTRRGQVGRDEVTHGDDRERLTGRQEAPQDLLDRARDYIQRTNAFMWLVDKLDLAFLGVFEW